MAMTIGSQELFNDLQASCAMESPKKTAASRAGPKVPGAKKRDPRIVEKKRLAEEKAAREVEHMKKAITRRVHEQYLKRDRIEAARLAEIESEQESFVCEVDEFLKIQHGKMHGQKKEMHNLWTEQVYMKIQNQIAARVKDINNDELNERLNELFQKYLDTVDSKMVFRDIIIESEYDPMENKNYTVKVDAEARSETRWDGIVDPLLEQIDKVMEIHSGDGRQKPISHQGKCPGKSTLPTIEWESGKIEATPHGFAAKLFDKSIAEASLTMEQKIERAKRNASSLNDGVMDHYDFPRTKESTLAELPKGKKCFPGWAPNGAEPTKSNPICP